MVEQTAAPASKTTTDLPALLARQRQALGAAGSPDLAQRIDTLDRLIDVNNRHEEALIRAIAAQELEELGSKSWGQVFHFVLKT